MRGEKANLFLFWVDPVRPGRGVATTSGLLGLLLFLLVVCPLQAAQPVLKELLPPGAQRGKTFTLTLRGAGLVTGAEIITTLPGTISRLAPPKDLETPDTQLSFLVQLAEDTPVGLYPLRVRTDDGLSNLLIFSVGDFPEISEKEPNDSIAQAQPITVPVTINGNLKGVDQDFYRLTAKAKQRLVMEVEARRMGSAIDPAIEVLDATGRRIAFNDDAPGLGVDSRVDVTVPKAGTYYVVVHDSKYSEQETTFYRLKIGSFAYAEGIFPLGWQRGKNVEVTFSGGNLEKPVKVRPKLDVPPEKHTIPINLPGAKPAGTLPFQFQVSDLPEVLAPGDGSVARLEPSTVVNGRIAKAGQVDRYKFRVSPGQKWLFELDAASLGTSQLYGLLAVLDAEGKKLKTKDLSESSDPKLAFAVPDKVEEVTVEVKDLRGLGGLSYSYRLLALPGSEDFALKITTPYVNVPAHGNAAIEVVAERHGYEGPVQLSIPDLPDDFIVAGGNIASQETDYYEGRAEPTTLGYLTITAKPEAKPQALRLSIWGQGGPADHPIRRRAEGPGLIFTVNGEDQYSLTADLIPPKPVTYPWLGMELPVALRKPVPAVLEVPARSVRVAQGLESPIAWKLVKQGPGIVTTAVSSLPLPSIKGLDVDSDQKPESKPSDEGKLMVNSKSDTPLVKLDVVPSATLQINGKEETVVAPAVTIELVRAFTLTLQSARMELKGSAKGELTGTIQREPSFTGTVKVRVGDPPDKVSCPPVEVPNEKSDFRLVCEAAPGAQEGDLEVHLVSSGAIPGSKDNRECTFPPVAARMIVAGGKPPQTAANARR